MSEVIYCLRDLNGVIKPKEAHKCSTLPTELHLIYSCKLYGNSFFSGFLVNGTADSPAVSYEPLKMSFSDSRNGYFKPGMPVDGTVRTFFAV